jgi:hypothetical protein
VTGTLDRFRSNGEIQPCSDWELLPLLNCHIRSGDHGEFAKITCSKDGESVTATCDNKDFSLLLPYLEELEAYLNNPETTEPPVVPVFFGSQKKVWRFSPIGARKLLRDSGRLNESIPEPGRTAPIDTDRNGAFRLQVTVSRAEAARFDEAARRKGLDRGTYLRQLICQHSTSPG